MKLQHNKRKDIPIGITPLKAVPDKAPAKAQGAQGNLLGSRFRSAVQQSFVCSAAKSLPQCSRFFSAVR